MKERLDSEPVFSRDPSPVVLRELEVRTVLAEELPGAARLLEEEHCLGAGKPVGKTLVQAVHHRGRWVALLSWGPAALKLNDREEWIGWTPEQRTQRLGLVAQNRRFLVLSQTRMPNLASRALSLALKALPEAWQQTHGYRPLLAETFTDIERFEGTCYKVSGWVPCGLTKGFERHRADFYRSHKRPKKLWLKPLQRNARALLRAMDLPPAYQAGLNDQSPHRALPLKVPEIESLQDALAQVPDPRASNRTFSAASLLILVALALLAGRKHLAEIQRFGKYLTQKQRKLVCWPRKKGTQFRKAPSYSALYNLLVQLDPEAFAQTLSRWLQAHQGTLPRALALDGKYVRDQVLTLCLSEHETGAPVAITIAEPAACTPEAKKEGELGAARRLYPKTQLQGALVTGDALHCEKESAQLVLENGGDYFFQLKDNQPTALQHARSIAEGRSPLLPPAVASPVTGASINAK